MDPISAAFAAVQGLWLLTEVLVGATAGPRVTAADTAPVEQSREDADKAADEALRDEQPGDHLLLKRPPERADADRDRQ